MGRGRYKQVPVLNSGKIKGDFCLLDSGTLRQSLVGLDILQKGSLSSHRFFFVTPDTLVNSVFSGTGAR